MSSISCSSCSQALLGVSESQLHINKLLCNNCDPREDGSSIGLRMSHIPIWNDKDRPLHSVIGQASCERSLTNWSVSTNGHRLSSRHDRHVVKDVLDVRVVRVRRLRSDVRVRIRWEDSWKPMNWVDMHKEAKTVQLKGDVQKIRWKDTWEPLRYMDDGELKKKAIMLLEDKYGV